MLMSIMPEGRKRLALAALAVAVYAGMWVGYLLGWAWLDQIDSSALATLHDYGIRHPGWVRFWDVFCTVAGPAGVRVVGAVLVVVAVWRRNVRVAVFVVVSIELSFVVTAVAKGLADRPRPANPLADVASSSFPSGHAVAVMAGTLALLTVLLPLLRPGLKVVAMVLGALVVVAVGVGRVVLVVHHPSDVLAGWALGYLYFLACLVLIRPTMSETPVAPGSAP